MFGYLIPCDGGRPIGLSKVKLVLRLRSQSAPTEGREDAAELHFADGFWSVVTSAEQSRVQVNDSPCTGGRLMPGDYLSVGRHRYRISYHPPELAESPTILPPPPAPPRPTPPRPVENPVLGMLIPCAGGRAIMLRKHKIVVGRAPTCDVVLPNPIVSGRHCELDFIVGYWQAVDLDSRNGIFVDGMRYRIKWVFPGDVLVISTQRFRMEYVGKGDRPSAKDDDVPVLSKKSLMERAGLTEERLDSLAAGKEADEPLRKRWRIDEF
jgi:hypothetical protein